MASYRKLKSGWKVTISTRDAEGKLRQTSKALLLRKTRKHMHTSMTIKLPRRGVWLSPLIIGTGSIPTKPTR